MTNTTKAILDANLKWWPKSSREVAEKLKLKRGKR